MSKSNTSRKFYQAPSTFRILFRAGEDDYSVRPLTPHPEVAARGFRLLKLTGSARIGYDCLQQKTGEATCACLGFLKHGHKKPCRHLRMLVGAQMFSPIPTAAQVAAEQTTLAEEPVPLVVDEKPSEEKVLMALPV